MLFRSRKKAENQHKVANSVLNQITNGNHNILGVMVESFIEHGNQNIKEPNLTYGKSITDECIGWTETEELISTIYNRL